jgi:hypothetical protein
MRDLQTQVKQLKRPGLLVRAARFSIDEYRRNRDLPRLLPDLSLSGFGPALMALLDAEYAVNLMRLAQDHDYSLLRHIELLTAIMAEARDFEAATRLRDVT